MLEDSSTERGDKMSINYNKSWWIFACGQVGGRCGKHEGEI